MSPAPLVRWCWLLPLVISALLVTSCKDKKPAPAPARPATPIAKPPAPEPPEPPKPSAPLELVVKTLPRTALTIKVPKGSTIEAAIIGGADQVVVPGHGSMVVRPRLLMDKELVELETWAKGHQIQKYVKDVLKEGSGKTFTYLYAVTLGGSPQVIYHQLFQKRGKDYKCFANARSEAAARAFKAACDTIGVASEPGKGDPKKGRRKKGKRKQRATNY